MVRQKYSLRANATNFSLEEIKEGCDFAHKLNKKVYLTLNIVFHNEDMSEVEEYIKNVVDAGIDAFIVSDPFIISHIKNNYKNVEVHLSTQNSTSNYKAVEYFKNEGIDRVVLAREVGKKDMKEIIDKTHVDIEIKVVLKCDVRGSEEAVKNALEKINVEGVKIKVIRSGIGAITESDVILANASDAIVIGFNVVPSNITKEVAKEYSVEIRLYQIIYKLVEEMELAMKGLLDPEYEEKVLGTAEIKRMFKFSKVGAIAGCIVTSGIIKNKANVRVIRDGVIIYDGVIASLQREKDTVKEVKNGLECGITIVNFNDLKEKDVFEVYENVEVKR